MYKLLLLLCIFIVGCSETPREFYYGDIVLVKPSRETRFYRCSTDNTVTYVVGKVVEGGPLIYAITTLCASGPLRFGIPTQEIATTCKTPIVEDKQGYCNCYNPHGVAIGAIPCKLEGVYE